MLHRLVSTALYLVSEICIKDWEQVLRSSGAALAEMWWMAGDQRRRTAALDLLG